MGKIRVLIVDDSVVIRRLLSDCLAGDDAIEVVATAPNGTLALAKIPQVSPDLITLDVEMPGLSGIETLQKIREQHARLPVIMFSSLTERGAATTIEALSRGASDYVTKPANVGSAAAAMQAIREQLIPRIKALCDRAVGAPSESAAARPPIPFRARLERGAQKTSGGERIEVVAIGVSTGGPNALAAILPRIPAAIAVPILIVQHMPPTFTRMLADRLGMISRLTVREGQHRARPRAGEVWIAPGGKHMVVARDATGVHLELNEEPPRNSCRPAVDSLFHAVAQTYGARSLAVMLTGMGQDGLVGCAEIHHAGGRVIAQDEATSVVWGMPGFVVRAGLAERVLPLDDIGGEIARRAGAERVPSSTEERVAGGRA